MSHVSTTTTATDLWFQWGRVDDDSPKRHLAKSGDTLVVTTGNATGANGACQGCCEHPTVHRAAPTRKLACPKQCRVVLDHGLYDTAALGDLVCFIPNAQQNAWHVGVTQSLVDGGQKR